MDMSEVDQGVCFWSSSLPKDSKEARCSKAVDRTWAFMTIFIDGNQLRFTGEDESLGDAFDMTTWEPNVRL